MGKLSKGTTFSNGVTYQASDLNNLVDSALILPGAIIEQGAQTPDVLDSLLIYDQSAAGLAKCTFQNVIDSVIPSNAAANVAALRSLGPSATQALAGNDTRISSSVTGIRKGAGVASTDVAATAKDFIFPGVNINALTTVNLDLGDVFVDTLLSGNKNYTLTNQRDGGTKVFIINQNGKLVGFPGFLVIGTANTATWNVYSLVQGPGANVIVCTN